MAEIDNNPVLRALMSRQNIIGAPSPFAAYNLLNSGNQQLDLMFTQYAPQLLSAFGVRDFLPQQFPAQQLMDQVVSAKYMRAMAAAEDSSRRFGTDILADRLIRFNSNFDPNPVSPMGREQFKSMAGVVNNRAVMPLIESLVGAQNTEDLFFGRRGDPTQLQRAVNTIGFYRKDSVSGTNMMSAESLEQFSRQIYNNLYGPDADLNDISGFSAGRVGGIMTDLARRGLLPQSMSQIGVGQRHKEIADLGFDAAARRFSDAAFDRSIFGDTKALDDREAELSQKSNLTTAEANELAAIPAKRTARESEIDAVRDAFAQNLPSDQIDQLAGGADTIRRIDASRVANSLKGYTEAIGAVRQIFGDNGMGNAPMGQLIAALEALTQNSLSAMRPEKIANLMRRTQMAARDGGVSLEALIGLSARTGSQAQQLGLAPEIAAFANVAAIEHAAAMRDVGAFRPAFGNMDPDKAALFVAESMLNAQNSNVGRQLGAFERIVQSGGGAYDQSDAAKMLKAIKAGNTSFVNNAGVTVNIPQALGNNSIATMRGLADEMGFSPAVIDELSRDSATQEFNLTSVLDMARQGEEYKKMIGDAAVRRGKLLEIAGNKNINQATAEKINESFARNFGRDSVDLVNNQQSASERLAILRGTLRRSIVEASGLQGGAASAYADDMIENLFGSDPDTQIKNMNEFLLGQLAAANNNLETTANITLANTQQTYASRVVNASIQQSAMNNMRASLQLPSGDGSNIFQRMSDAMLGNYGSHGTFLGALLNTVDSAALEEQIMQEVGGKTAGEVRVNEALEAGRQFLSSRTIDTEAERKQLADDATKNHAAFETFKRQLAASNNSKFVDKKLVTNQALRAKLEAGTDDDLAALYTDLTGSAVSEKMQKKDIIDEIMNKAGAVDTIASRGFLDAGETTEQAVRDYINNESTFIYDITATNGVSDADKARISAFTQLGDQITNGAITGNILTAAYGVTNDNKLTDGIDAYLTRGDKAAFDDALKNANIDAQTKRHIESMTLFSKGVMAVGGIDMASAKGASARRVIGSRIAAVEKSKDKLDTNKPIVTVVEDLMREEELQKKVADNTITTDEQKELDNIRSKKQAYDVEHKKALDALQNTADDGAAFKQTLSDSVDTTKGNRDETATEIMSDAKGMLGSAAEAGGGIVSQISNALASAMGELFKNVKLENVTVQNFTLPQGFGVELGQGLATAITAAVGSFFSGGAAASPAAVTAAAPRGSTEMALTGSLRLDGLNKLVADLQGYTDTEIAPGGIPISTQSVRPPGAGTIS